LGLEFQSGFISAKSTSASSIHRADQAARAIAAEVGYAAGGGLHLRVQPVGDPGFRGVTMRSNAFHGSKMWMSHIHENGTHLALGSFDTKEEAAAAFDGAAGHHFKEGAKCNFDMEMEDAVSADEASREAIQTRQLIHEGRRIALIKKRAILDFGLGRGYSEAEALVAMAKESSLRLTSISLRNCRFGLGISRRRRT
jgi:hypothetical protein